MFEKELNDSCAHVLPDSRECSRGRCSAWRELFKFWMSDEGLRSFNLRSVEKNSSYDLEEGEFIEQCVQTLGVYDVKEVYTFSVSWLHKRFHTTCGAERQCAVSIKIICWTMSFSTLKSFLTSKLGQFWYSPAPAWRHGRPWQQLTELVAISRCWCLTGSSPKRRPNRSNFNSAVTSTKNNEHGRLFKKCSPLQHPVFEVSNHLNSWLTSRIVRGIESRNSLDRRVTIRTVDCCRAAKFDHLCSETRQKRKLDDENRSKVERIVHRPTLKTEKSPLVGRNSLLGEPTLRIPEIPELSYVTQKSSGDRLLH